VPCIFFFPSAIVCLFTWNKIVIHILIFIFLKMLKDENYCIVSRRVWRDQRGNRNPYIEEQQITQWPKEKGQKNKYTHQTKDRVTWTPLQIRGELGRRAWRYQVGKLKTIFYTFKIERLENQII
jgi:hypothetical protein